jgi:hypothetical protein
MHGSQHNATPATAGMSRKFSNHMFVWRVISYPLGFVDRGGRSA